MKNNTWTLIKTQLMDQFGFNELRYEKNKKKRNRVLIFITTMIILYFVFAGYSFAIGYGLGRIGLAGIIPGLAFTMTSLLVLLFTVFKASGLLFASKDFDMVMSLPVSSTAVINSKFFVMYGMNILFSLIVMLPMGIAYGMFAHPQLLFYIIWFFIILVTPLLPMAIAILLSFIISAVSSRFRHTNAISIVLSFILMVALLGVCMSTGTINVGQMSIKQLAYLGKMFSQKMNQLYPLTGIIEKAASRYNIAALLVFIVISLACYLLFIEIVSIKYKAINTALTTHRTNSDYRLHDLKAATPFEALYRKELKRFFSSTIYVVNIGMGAVLSLAASIAFCVLGADKIAQMTKIPGIKSTITNFMPFVISAMLASVCTTCVSLSLEGKNLWILKSSPVDTATIYRSKMAVNISIILPSALLSSLLINLSLKADLISAVWIFVTPLAYAGFTSVWGMFVNLKMPNFSWESEVTVIKQSMASMLGIIGGLIFGIIPVGILMLLHGVNKNLLTGAITLVVISITVLLYKTVCMTKLPDCG